MGAGVGVCVGEESGVGLGIAAEIGGKVNAGVGKGVGVEQDDCAGAVVLNGV